jgi:hypothetical protein
MTDSPTELDDRGFEEWYRDAAVRVASEATNGVTRIAYSR